MVALYSKRVASLGLVHDRLEGAHGEAVRPMSLYLIVGLRLELVLVVVRGWPAVVQAGVELGLGQRLEEAVVL